MEQELGVEVPDVPVEALTVFEHPDIRLEEVVPFPRIDTSRGSLREWVESLAFTVLFVLVFTSYVAQATQVPTESMKPTIMVGDHFFLDKLGFRANYPEVIRQFLPPRAIERGDIVAFKSPTDQSIPFVKRVIGIPGDKLEIRSKSVYINDQKLDEPYKIHVDSSIYSEEGWTPEDLRIRDSYGPVTLQEDSYFVMGDNRDNSNDSRFWGTITRDHVIGKPLFVYWSYEADPYVPGERTIAEYVETYSSIAVNFFSRTRWFRIGTVIQ